MPAAPAHNAPPTWRSIATTVACAGLTVCAVDLALQQASPIVRRTEVEDALQTMTAAPRQVLAIGSSHGRTFEALDLELQRRSNGAIRCTAIPVEFGKWSSYHWVLEHRVGPQLPTGSAAPRHLVLITEWWDSTPPPDGHGAHGRAQNLPSRAWQLGDFVHDVAQNGLTPFNRNYLAERFRRLFSRSILVQDRGHGRVLVDLKDRIRERNEGVDRRNHDLQVEGWRTTVEAGRDLMFEERETEAFEKILAWADARDFEVTILLYPRMPITVTPAATAPGGTLYEFAAGLQQRYGSRVARIIDSTSGTPLTDEHFASDFDHLTREGHALLAEWLLDGPLRFLAEDGR